MGIIFQPRPPVAVERATAPASHRPRGSTGRAAVFVDALECVVRGDADRFDALFTEDVVFTAPHVRVASLAALHSAIGQPEDTLGDITIAVRPIAVTADEVVAEWQIRAVFDHPALFDDNLLVEPTGQTVTMAGASFAEFRADRIRSFRHYFDDSELLDGAPAVPAHLRWSGRRL
jgi:ketosteroid isomerase-like protein